MATKGKEKDTEVVSIRFRKNNRSKLRTLEEMIGKSNMNKNEYLEALLLGHIEGGKKLTKKIVTS